MQLTRVWCLLGRKLAGEASLEELQELEQYLIEDPTLAASVEMHTAYFEGGNTGVTVSDPDKKSWEKQRERLEDEFPGDFRIVEEITSSTRNKNRRIWYAVAVAVLLVIMTGIVVLQDNYIFRTGGSNKIAKNGSVVEFGGRKRMVLPDGSLVWLNKNSDISFDKNFGVHNRNITLSGEAFFDVVHKGGMPMIVNAGLVTIKVKGTAFNVFAYPGEHKVETSLIRGSVELTLKNKPGEKVLMKPNEKIIVTQNKNGAAAATPGDENLQVRLDKLVMETQTGLIPEIAWIDNKLVFKDEPFEAVAEKMKRWYNRDIIILDPVLAREKFTGAFETETFEEALAALKLTYDFKYKTDNEGKTIIMTEKK